jgi:hypothetical protein
VSEARIEAIEARQRRGYPWGISSRLPSVRAPIALGAFLALPLFFGSLMAVSLAIESPREVAWKRAGGHLARTFHDPTSANEWHIWLLALVLPLLLVLWSLVAAYLPFGIYLTCIGACIAALATTQRLHRWEVHHTTRFPYGEDNIADFTNSSLYAHGEWEHDAVQTVRSFAHYTIGLAIAAAVITFGLTLRRRRAPVTGAPSAMQQTGGAPTSTQL